MTKKDKVKSREVRKSDDYREFYAQVQQWSVTETEVIISFIRAEPKITEIDGELGSREAEWINEATVYIPITQAKSMCEMLSKSISDHHERVKAKH